MTAPLAPAELNDLESLYAKATQECVCRFACECGSLDAERKLEALLPDAFPRLAAALRAAWGDKCPKCGLGPMKKVEDSAARYCLNCIHFAASQAESDGLNEWMEAANEYKAERDTLAARLAEAERLLRPFAKEVRPFSADRGADGWDGAPDDCPLHLYSRCWNGNVGVTVGDCVAAAAFLAQQTTPTAAAPQEK